MHFPSAPASFKALGRKIRFSDRFLGGDERQCKDTCFRASVRPGPPVVLMPVDGPKI